MNLSYWAENLGYYSVSSFYSITNFYDATSCEDTRAFQGHIKSTHHRFLALIILPLIFYMTEALSFWLYLFFCTPNLSNVQKYL